MKKIIAILLLLAMCFSLYACEEKPTNTNAENTNTNAENTNTNAENTNTNVENTNTNVENTNAEESITLTTNNFKDYFAVQLDPQNIREYDEFPTCDLVVKIDSLTYKKLSNVTVTLKINVIAGDYYHPKSSVNNEFTRTVSIPANGSIDFRVVLRADYYAALGIPKISDFKIEILAVTGTLY